VVRKYPGSADPATAPPVCRGVAATSPWRCRRPSSRRARCEARVGEQELLELRASEETVEGEEPNDDGLATAGADHGLFSDERTKDLSNEKKLRPCALRPIAHGLDEGPVRSLVDTNACPTAQPRASERQAITRNVGTPAVYRSGQRAGRGAVRIENVTKTCWAATPQPGSSPSQSLLRGHARTSARSRMRTERGIGQTRAGAFRREKVRSEPSSLPRAVTRSNGHVAAPENRSNYRTRPCRFARRPLGRLSQTCDVLVTKAWRWMATSWS
jgi:hypothetical protein